MTKLAFDRLPRGMKRARAVPLVFDRDTMRTMDEDGRLHVKDCPLTKATVNDYYGMEIPGWEELGLDPKRMYAMLRSPDALETAAKAGKFDGIPLLDTHTEHDVDTPVKKNLAGAISAGCYFDGEYVRTPLLSVWARPDIEGIEQEKKRELSASYAYEPVMKPGNFKGLHYDGYMDNIVPNHVALVERGRAGRDVLVMDALPEGFRMKRTNFDRFVKRAAKLFANDADIDAEELVHLLANAGTAGGAEDDDLTPDPNAMDESEGSHGAEEDDGEGEKAWDADLPANAMSYLKGKLTDDEMGELGAAWKAPKAEDAEGGEGGEGEEDEGEDGTRANDRAPRRPRAMDAQAIRNQVVREMSQWNTACEKVQPHIGRVKLAMDAVPGGAATLYKRALDAHGIGHAGVTQVVALERMVDMLPASSRPTMAHDALPAGEKSPLDNALEGAVRIARS